MRRQCAWAEICCALFASAYSGLELLQVAGGGDPLFRHPLFRHLCLLRILANYTHENISISQTTETSNVVRI